MNPSISDDDCFSAAIGAGVDPSGVPWSELDPDVLRAKRTSIKWRRYPADVLPMFVAEMDFAVAAEVRAALISAIEASDIGYIDRVAPLAEAFADFAHERWGWQINTGQVHLATDVATGVVEALRVGCPGGGNLALSTPTYPGFFEMLQEVPFKVTEIELVRHQAQAQAHQPTHALDLSSIEREFASGIDAFILCNPHNPHGLPFSRQELTELARLAAEYDVFVVSDEVHAPLTHRDATFTPFAPLAAEAGATAVTATSASKAWNLAGAKCSVIVAADERANKLLRKLPPEVFTRTSLLGLHASVAALTSARGWLDRTVAQIEANVELFARLSDERLEGVSFIRPKAGYLGWLDLREAGIGPDPALRLRTDGKLALNRGARFGAGGAGHARINLACAPETIVRAVDSITTALQHRRPA